MSDESNTPNLHAETNLLLGRVARALEAIVLHGWGVDLAAPPLTPEQIKTAEKEAEDQERRDTLLGLDDPAHLDELVAIVEMIDEEAPGRVPAEVYRRLNIDPPEGLKDPGDISADVLTAPQPGTDAVKIEDYDQASDTDPEDPDPSPYKRESL